ncbi:headcase protein [Sergentomyia squamirostris]
MAPRRNNGSHHSTVAEMHNLLGMDPDSLDAAPGSPSGEPTSAPRCCVPTGDCLKAGALDLGLIGPDELRECVRVVCNNEHCTAGQFMHRECFDTWEQGVLSYLKSIGRARSWSDRQRQQNLWTKKGYDLVFKACSCKCGRGHLKKDLDWVPPAVNGAFGRTDDEANKKKKKRNRNNQKPVLLISTGTSNTYHPNSQLNGNTVVLTTQEIRARTGSLSSSNGSSSPPASASSHLSISPIHNGAVNTKRSKSKIELHSERVR